VSLSLALRQPKPIWARRFVVGVIILILTGALSVATFSRSDLANKLRDAADNGVSSLKTVAALLADRSPGERPAGALASLKHKRQPALHERALPKVRKPESPLASIIGTPPVPPVELPLTTPLYAMVSSPPLAQTLVPGGSGGGSPPGETPPPGGGGGIVVPPETPTTPVTPVTPVTPAVPEPATWGMMLLGFGLMGWAIRRDKRMAAAATVK
jgi:hypothetical protein